MCLRMELRTTCTETLNLFLQQIFKLKYLMQIACPAITTAQRALMEKNSSAVVDLGTIDTLNEGMDLE